MILEACVENLSEALKAESRGANRIELCDNLYVGGTTPSAGTIQMAIKALNIPVMVLIRPRSGNFVYSDLEVNIMKHDIQVCKQTGVQGIVIGALKTDHYY
jgi:copper homeostasis protein